jgi:uncharacterized protein (DUF433 family)
MIEINVIWHPLGGSRAESIATATIGEDGRVTAWSGRVRTQTLIEPHSVSHDEIWRGIEEIARAVAAAQQTTTTRERSQAPVVRRPGVMGMLACFRGTRVPISVMPLYLTTEEALAEFLENFPSVRRNLVVKSVVRAFELLERDAPLDLLEGR